MKHAILSSLVAAALCPWAAPHARDAGEETVTVREDAGQRVWERRIDGRLVEVRVKPSTGPEYTIEDRDGDGTFSTRGDGLDTGVNIRTWKIGEW